MYSLEQKHLHIITSFTINNSAASEHASITLEEMKEILEWAAKNKWDFDDTHKEWMQWDYYYDRQIGDKELTTEELIQEYFNVKK